MNRDFLIRQFLAWHNEKAHAQRLEAHHVQSVVIHAWPRHTYDCPLRVNYSYAVGSVDERAEQAFEKAQDSYERALQLYEIQMLRWEEQRRAEQAELRRRRAADPEDIAHGLRGAAHDLGGFGGPRKPVAPTIAEYATYHKRSGKLTGCQLKVALPAGGLALGLLWRTPGLAGVIDEEKAFDGLIIQRHEVDGKALAKAIQACAKEAGELVATKITAEGLSLVAGLAVEDLQPAQAPDVEWRYTLEVDVASHDAGKTRKQQVNGFVRLAEDGAPVFVFAGNPLFTVEHATKRRNVMFAICAGVVVIGAGVWFAASRHNDAGAAPAANQGVGVRNAVTPPSLSQAAAASPQSEAQGWAKRIEPAGLVVDTGGALSTDAKGRMESALSDLQHATGWRARILIVPDTGKAALEDAAREVANYWQAERGQDMQALILVTTQSRNIRLEVSSELSAQLTDQVASELVHRAFVPAARSDGLEAGLVTLVQELKRVRKASA